MIHKPILLQNLSCRFGQKLCFENFNASIMYGDRIAIIGRNGSGKTTLLNMIGGILSAEHGEITLPAEINMGRVSQVITEFDTLSGGERLNKALTHALGSDPNLLLLDEPTNHFDQHHRAGLLRRLQTYTGTLLIISHDLAILNSCINTLWHIEDGHIQIFKGKYQEYLQHLALKRAALEQSLTNLQRQRKTTHTALMKEQERAKKSRLRGEKHIRQNKWPTMISDAKARQGVETAGRKQKTISTKKEDLLKQLSQLQMAKVIKPSFTLRAAKLSASQMLISIQEGAIGYQRKILENINFQLMASDRIAITGNNGSGKTTFIKGILGDEGVSCEGSWQKIDPKEIGYLDQHYQTLNLEDTVYESIYAVSRAADSAIRKHLADFLFFTNEQINCRVSDLSGGEKARLSLARIAAKTPKLLIVDEITNNLDLETRAHVVQVLKNYPGAIIVISHDEDFLQAVGIRIVYQIKQAKIIVSS